MQLHYLRAVYLLLPLLYLCAWLKTRSGSCDAEFIICHRDSNMILQLICLLPQAVRWWRWQWHARHCSSSRCHLCV